MSRQARVVAEGVPHHVTQRGNNRQDAFLLDEDRRFYIEALRAQSEQHGLTILGYCLMSNHGRRLVAIPNTRCHLPAGLTEPIGVTALLKWTASTGNTGEAVTFSTEARFSSIS